MITHTACTQAPYYAALLYCTLYMQIESHDFHLNRRIHHSEWENGKRSWQENQREIYSTLCYSIELWHIFCCCCCCCCVFSMIHFTRTKTVENAKHWLSSFAIWLTLTYADAHTNCLFFPVFFSLILLNGNDRVWKMRAFEWITKYFNCVRRSAYESISSVSFFRLLLLNPSRACIRSNKSPAILQCCGTATATMMRCEGNRMSSNALRSHSFAFNWN